MDTREYVIQRLYQLCDQRRLSLTGLARRAALPPSTVKNIVNGSSKNPGIVTIKKICDGIDISLIEFFDTPEFNSVEQEIR